MADVTHISAHPQFAGSKKKRRRAEREARRVQGVKNRLGRIYQLAQLLQSEEELDRYLETIPDDATRAEVRNLIEPFCRFEIKKRVVLASPSVAVGLASLPPMSGPKPNVDGAFPFERDFRESENRLVANDLPHEEQVRATAHFLAHSFELPVLKLIRDEGFEAFATKTRAAQHQLAPDGTRIDYTDDDLRRMYAFVLKELAAREGRADMHVSH